MKFASFAASVFLFFSGCSAGQGALAERPDLSRAIAAAVPELLRARYVLRPSSYSGASAEAPEALLKALKVSGFSKPGTGRPPKPAWSELAQKAAFFSAGWIWITDAEGKSMRSVWFEPDLRADGRIEWCKDATQLRLKADGWRHWIHLDLELETQKK